MILKYPGAVPKPGQWLIWQYPQSKPYLEVAAYVVSATPPVLELEAFSVFTSWGAPAKPGQALIFRYKQEFLQDIRNLGFKRIVIHYSRTGGLNPGTRPTLTLSC